MKLQNYEKRNLQILRRSLAECTVLLKSNGDFPLDTPGQIALYGNGVRNTVKGGTGSGEVNSRCFVTVERAFRELGFTITTLGWLNDYDNMLVEARKDFHQQVRLEAKEKGENPLLYSMGQVMVEPDYELPLNGEGDTAIYVLARNSGEGNDRKVVKGDYLLTDTEVRDILALNEKYNRFMLALNVGGPVDLTPVLEVDNILVLSQLGVHTGTALADIVLGKYNPSGKLATTWAAATAIPEILEFDEHSDTHYYEGVYVGYRYYDSMGIKPLFPFGYGLSYTSFALGTPEVDVDGEQVTVTISVTNVGYRSGKEVVQVYAGKPQGKLDQPYQCLAAFRKTGQLQPGQSECLTISFAMHDMASYSAEEEAYILEAGNYVLRVGNSSASTSVAAVLQLDDEVMVLKARNCLGDCGFADWKPADSLDTANILKANTQLMEEILHAPMISLERCAIRSAEVNYELEETIDPAVEKLDDSELALLNMGAFDPKGGFTNVIGSAGKQVAGAAGETTGRVDGIPALVMADGPAGLRISRQYFKDEQGGIHSVGSTLPETMVESLPWPIRQVLKLFEDKPKKDQEIYEQYATAIPIGTALAQSWNPAFARECGDIVGGEMERFGVHLWLAPALNIHRSVLCGRNFEYYSEDPLISGSMAAAVTEGVQKHPGRGTTIKHYAANNQEYNRYSNNSCVSERAMREIYLKGFGICVDQSQPKALMTSYNLLNGVHTNEHRGLIYDILRCEYGYQGVVMTDWIVAMMQGKNEKYPGPVPGKVAAAGNDLFMPGGKKDYEALMKALEEGLVSRQALQINASRVRNTIHELVK